ncbi:hypothetical protein [Methylomonas sp. MgM2]
MNTIAIDNKMLNDLFSNQKKVDELFDSIFDDDSYFINSAASLSQASRYEPEAESQFLKGENGVRESVLMIRKHNPYYLILPVILEITAIYMIVTNLL